MHDQVHYKNELVSECAYLIPAAISLGFEKAAYTVQEDAGTLDNFVFVIKENEKQTEQVLNILLHEGASIAEKGQ